MEMIKVMNERDKSKILEKYKVSESDLIGCGTEARVYSCHEGRVLKVYNNISDFNKQKILKNFYETIDSREVSYELPRIYHIIEESGTIITIEKRIEGENMQKLLPQLNDEQINNLFKTYLAASLELQNVRTNTAFTNCKLFNDYYINSSEQKDWHSFLKQFLTYRQEGLKDYFSKDVLNYNIKLEKLLKILSSEYEGKYSLIHGDFYPGNLLINEDGRIIGLIDFGIMTMYGDYLFDIATAWAFFDMYDELKANILERYLQVIIENLGEGVRGKLYLYVLIYSMISADFYSVDCNDGHYQWCVKNLNNEVYWNELI
jgi:thiamine kinase-like enzyme